ncbi:hypothetical protein KDN24_01150 [Bacillus sp. Bva_UNVM-123]|uniref:hypothetical protein n=1 Tax=Bacillus sp. Bva_UNVM-123 TaxID=2829798 RepID=UPI00391FB456
MLMTVGLFFLALNDGTHAQASELSDSFISMPIDIESEEAKAKEVDQDVVIQDYMDAFNVDRETAIKDLGISEIAPQEDNPSCFTKWYEYSTGKYEIDSLSKSYLTLYPYIQIKDCSSTNIRIALSVSPNIRAEVSSGLTSNAVEIEAREAMIRTNQTVVDTKAYGNIRNFLGIKLRDWQYKGAVNTRGTIIWQF